MKNKFLKMMPVATLVIGLFAGLVLSHKLNSDAFAVSATAVDQGTLEQIYDAAFGRPLDSEAGFHIGRDLTTVLNDINHSPERRYYSALFKAVKSYEGAIRAPGQLSPEDKAAYLSSIDSALATLIAWVETLPEHPICEGVIRPEEVKQVISDAYDSIPGTMKNTSATHGVFEPGKNLGRPADITLPVFRCFETPKPKPTFTPFPCPLNSSTNSATTIRPCEVKPTPHPTCLPRPACLDATPRCLIAEPAGGWCTPAGN